jgi:hypothetical protein
MENSVSTFPSHDEKARYRLAADGELLARKFLVLRQTTSSLRSLFLEKPGLLGLNLEAGICHIDRATVGSGNVQSLYGGPYTYQMGAAETYYG